MTIAIGHSNPRSDRPACQGGDIVVLDVGAIFEGYVSDNRRLAYIGKVEEDLRKLNATMAEIVVQTGMSAAQACPSETSASRPSSFTRIGAAAYVPQRRAHDRNRRKRCG